MMTSAGWREMPSRAHDKNGQDQPGSLSVSRMHIRRDNLAGNEVIDLLREHLHSMTLHSPSASIHALDVEALRQPQISFWTAWHGGELPGCGALKQLDAQHAEIRSMRTASRHRRKGVAAAMLEHLLQKSRQGGYRRLSLETGSAGAFTSAHRLYARFGFTFCEPFADYIEDPCSVCMSRQIQ